jgi:hypothetical protein
VENVLIARRTLNSATNCDRCWWCGIHESIRQWEQQVENSLNKIGILDSIPEAILLGNGRVRVFSSIQIFRLARITTVSSEPQLAAPACTTKSFLVMTQYPRSVVVIFTASLPGRRGAYRRSPIAKPRPKVLNFVLKVVLLNYGAHCIHCH